MRFSVHSHEAETPIHTRAVAPANEDDGTESPPASERLPLSDLWDRIRAGTHFVREGYYSSERCFLGIELREQPPPPRRRLRMDVLEKILSGEPFKRVAMEHSLAISTVSIACADCLDAVSSTHAASRAPLLLVMAAHAHRGVNIEPARVYRMKTEGREQWVVAAERPDRTLPGHLTAAEAAVIRLLVEGLSHEQMGAARKTSRRTVANQLAQAFQKLGVSGRADLIRYLVRRAANVTLSPPREAGMSKLTGIASSTSLHRCQTLVADPLCRLDGSYRTPRAD